MEDLSSHLTVALLHFPQLLDDFPSIIASLDSGESVNVEAIQDIGLRDALTNVLRCLPVKYEQHSGWYKLPEVVSVGGILLMELLNAGSIKQPSALSEAETLASRTAPLRLLTMLGRFPELRADLPGLLDSLLDGQALQLDGLENQEVADQLTQLLRALGVVETIDGLSLPTGSTKTAALRSLYLMREAFRLGKVTDAAAASSVEEEDEEEKEKEKKHRKRGRDRDEHVKSSSNRAAASESDESSGSSSDSDDGEDERSAATTTAQRHTHHAAEQPVPVAASAAATANANANVTASATASDSAFPVAAKGPAMPPGFQRPNVAESDNYSKNGDDGDDDDDDDDDDDEDDDLGPLPVWKAPRRTMQPIVELPKGPSSLVNALSTDLPEGLDVPAAQGREEWMLTPGESKAFDALEGTFGKTREFKKGKQASQAAKALQAKKAAVDAASRAAPMDAAMNAALEEYKALRGPSLMDIHAEKAAQMQAAKKGNKGDRAGFDYARDVGSFRQRVDTTVRAQMVTDAQRLDTRFDKSMQRGGG